MWIGHAQLLLPIALMEERREDTPKWALFIKKAHAANADGVVAAGSQTTYNIGGIKDIRGIGGSFAAGEASGKEPGMSSWCCGRWEKAGEEGLMCGISEAAG